ncbi:peroxiredoxin [Candidatus Uhrbacteria bacterium]|mgnify:CR=1 FL=1|jgi:peroxiredoxin 2/4|nr:peroxiredoxin [Candidatus Uhrbacteria bacterium]MBT7717469.1 peroxiredoxin [Candidatus Uhrbacteria bacterium]
MIQLESNAPEFSGVMSYHQGEFKKISLADYKGKWVALFFYPRDFTFVCPTELKGFAKHAQEFADLDCEIIAVSTDSEWSHKAWFEKDLPDVKYPALADVTHQISKDYQVYNEAEGLAERGLFLISPEGIVKYIVISAGNVGRSSAETLRVLKALQTGDLCPMEWETGQETLGKA